MRVGMLRHDAHAHPIPVAVTATYETLCSMAAGALLGVLLLPQLGVLPVEVSGQTTRARRGGGAAGRARGAEQARGAGGGEAARAGRPAAAGPVGLPAGTGARARGVRALPAGLEPRADGDVASCRTRRAIAETYPADLGAVAIVLRRGVRGRRSPRAGSVPASSCWRGPHARGSPPRSARPTPRRWRSSSRLLLRLTWTRGRSRAARRPRPVTCTPDRRRPASRRSRTRPRTTARKLLGRTPGRTPRHARTRHAP